MDMQQAKDQSEWGEASRLLLRAVERLNVLGKPLWTETQVSVDGLRRSYQLEELYFFMLGSQRIGVVFLQESDPFFWPEITDKNTLYIHKLAIDPSLAGKGYGLRAILAVCKEAENRGYDWVRIDCDDRPELHHFYQRCGFELIDIKQIDVFKVARYQLLTRAGNQPCSVPLEWPSK